MTFRRTAALLFVLSLASLDAAIIDVTVGGPSTLGIIGGDSNNATQTYAAFVAADGTVTPLVTQAGAVGFTTQFSAVALNSTGTALIGGVIDSGTAYAALATPNGTVTTLSGGGLGGASTINSTAINSSGNGIIGGATGGIGYTALVAPNATVTPLGGPATPPINSVAINSSGLGLIGGGTAAYAAFVFPNGSVSQLSGGSLPFNGTIHSVAINDSGTGLIGGQNFTTFNPFVAFVTSSGSVTPLGGLPGNTSIFTVALNSSGAGIVGGENFNTTTAYAALVSTSSSTVTPLSGANLTSATIINSIAINSSGAGIIGGNGATGYAALVTPNGVLTQLTGASAASSIEGVAINEAGVVLIGGVASGPAAYAALVAPNGTLTVLSGLPAANSNIASVALTLLGPGVLHIVTPQSIGPYTSAINALFMATQALEVHLSSQLSFRAEKPVTFLQFPPPLSTPSQSFLPSLVPSTPHFADPASAGSDVVLQEYKKAQGTFTLWASPFGDYLHQRKQGLVPAFSNRVAGGLLGFDYHPSDYLVGGGVAYAFNHIHYGQDLGHANMQEEMAFAYYGYYTRNVWFVLDAWGGLYQCHNLRHAPIVGTASAHIHGWLLDPHVEVATPIRFDWLLLEPFGMVDWAMNWQNSFKEKNLAGFALKVGDQFNKLVRSEAGVRLYETVRYKWGKFVIEEKVSYINRAPLGTHTSDVAFVGSTSFFPIAIVPTHIENLGGAELRAMFLPWDNAYPYGLIDAQVELGSSFQSYFVSFELGKNF